jgi:hypothetical protein
MLQQLAGRLMWERTPGGIRVAIPTRRGAVTVLYGPVVGIWLVAVSIHYWHALEMPRGDSHEFMLQLMAVAVYALGFCFAICWLIWTFTNETILTLDAAELKLQRRAMGIELFTESYPTMSVRNVNYVPPTRSWASQDDTDPKTSKIQFQAGFLTRTFASGVTEAEAKALIAGMQGIYKFPNYLESHGAHPAP